MSTYEVFRDNVNDGDPVIGINSFTSDITITEFSENTVNTQKYVSFFSTVMNLLNSLIGAEILSISNSMRFCGVYVSIGLMTATALLSYFATIMTIKLEKDVNAESLSDMATKILGKAGSRVLAFLTLFFTYSCEVAYLIIGGNNISSWLSLIRLNAWTTGYRRSIVMLIYSLVLPVMLTLPKQITFISMFSTFAFFSVLGFTGVMIFKGYSYFQTHTINPTVKSYEFNLGFFNALAIYSLMFALPAIILPVLKPFHPSISKRYRVVGTSFFACYMFVIIPGVIGYLMFGQETHEIILTSFSNGDLAVQAVRVGLFIAVTASYPVIMLSIGSDLSALIFHQNNPNNLNTKSRSLVLLVGNIPPVLVAMVCPFISPVLAIGGALGGCMTNFFFPSLMWLVNSKKHKLHWTNIFCLLLVIFGFVSACIATYRAVIVAMHPHSDD